ncbi:hypothetical protein ARC78_03745 [Stenotrophomonas pictorum JCM 9942]|jgi:prepilin-type N-terminal cleavage/methylation domain-containing protein|uniref:Prepilin-type N-terminal cleavage/methylation domain-containing protein n=1 Tax=Stenotrophomonas pictorum JCM 9942 TaxID=1236960 RepID=A0A0R0AJ03_9GAMM|nr:prepilin-type N-terminal cleavage/methylation domain-containing protein [Stenotrophomonas pictorum]KRG44933.1 hypothetical protein ARC78_03745 [Stenotrophomonas pictorum JCM 9942]
MALPRRQRGFNLVELSVVTGIIGLLSALGVGAFELYGQSRDHARAQAELAEARNALRAFLVRNKRLPCPDSSEAAGSSHLGRETPGTGTAVASCPAALRVGWLPYESLGLSLPPLEQRLRYAVYRKAGTDLTRPLPRSAEFTDQDGTAGLLATLADVTAQPGSTGQPYYKVPAGTAFYPADPAGATPACDEAGDTVNPAFALVAPGRDRDGDSASPHPRFDTVNNGFASGSSLCMANPDRPSSFRHDDLVLAESAGTLLGWLTALER